MSVLVERAGPWPCWLLATGKAQVLAWLISWPGNLRAGASPLVGEARGFENPGACAGLLVGRSVS